MLEIKGLHAACLAARDDPQVRVVVLQGAGDRAFCSGADLGGMRHNGDDAEGPSYLQTHLDRGELAAVG